MIKEWLKDTYEIYPYPGVNIQKIRKRITCNDEFSLSVQASDAHYCRPRRSLPNGEYSSVEIGFPSLAEDLISEYAEDDSNLTGTVYACVPVDVVEKVIEKHGGIKY